MQSAGSLGSLSLRLRQSPNAHFDRAVSKLEDALQVRLHNLLADVGVWREQHQGFAIIPRLQDCKVKQKSIIGHLVPQLRQNGLPTQHGSSQ